MTNNDIKVALILHQLGKKEQYGAELMDNILSVTENTVDLKSAQLYSIMKNLSSTGLVQSYWEDSDIGGKRHYYKLTPKGTTALHNYPTEQEIVKDLIKAKYSNLPATDYNNLDIDTSSNYDINLENIKLSNSTPTASVSEQTFLSTTNYDKINVKLDKNVFASEKEREFEEDYTNAPTNVIMNVARRDSKDYSTDAGTIARKKLFDKICIKSVVSFAIQVFVLVLSFILTRRYTERTIVNVVIGVISIISAIYLLLFFANHKSIRYTILDGKYKFNAKKYLFIASMVSLISFVALTILVVVLNAAKVLVTDYIQFLYILVLCLLPIIDALLNFSYTKKID